MKLTYQYALFYFEMFAFVLEWMPPLLSSFDGELIHEYIHYAVIKLHRQRSAALLSRILRQLLFEESAD